MMEWPKFFMALVTGAAEHAAVREASSAARSRAIVVALCVNPCRWLFPHRRPHRSPPQC